MKRRDIEKETGVAIMPRNLPGIPQWDTHDFFKWSLITLDTSIGEVLIELIFGMLGLLDKGGTWSLGFVTVALAEKWLFNKLLFSWLSVTVLLFSIRDGMDEN